MLTGEAYLHSDQKARFDNAVAIALKPAYVAARIGAAASFGFVLYCDKRVGQNGELVDITKIQTLDANGDSLSPLAESYRKKGLDELPQLELVRDGIMSIVGTRHLLPNEFDMMRDIAVRSNDTRELLRIYDELVLPAKRGLLSTFALQAHIGGESDIRHRLTLDVADHSAASVRNDIKLIGKIFRSTAMNELSNGMNHITELNK